VVPSVKKLTLAQAQTRLLAHGLKSGVLSYAYSATVPLGRVISAGRSGLAAKGAAIPLKISRGVFRSVSPPVPPQTTTGFGGTGSSTPPPFTSPTGGFSTPGAPPSTGGEGAPPPAAGGDPEPDGVEPQSYSPAAEESASGLRRALGFALLGGAFLAAGAVALRSRRMRLVPRGTVTGEDSLLFWDQRLARAVTGSMRRLAGRF
jgi:hypothetical protein